MNLFVIGFLLFLFYFLNSGYQKYKKLSPNQLNGPLPLPIVGNLHQITPTPGSPPHLKATELHKIYGPIYRIFFGDVYTVIVSDPQLIKEMFIDNFENFVFRPKCPTFTHFTNYYGISTSNERWGRTKELVTKAIRKSSIKHVYDILDDQVQELIKSMKGFQSTGEPFEMHLYAQRFTISIMFKYIFNESVSYDEDIKTGTIAELIELFDAITIDLGSAKLGDFISILSPIYLKYLELTENKSTQIKKFIRQRYDQHLSTIDPKSPRDLLDILINEYSNLDEESVKTILGTCFDFFIAGNDTTASSIIWFTLRMKDNPDIQDIAYNELRSVLGKDRNSVKLSDRPSTPYVNAIIKENLRLNPVAPFGLPHECANDISIGQQGKFFIPKGCQVMVNYKGIAFDEKYFKNALEFNPSRFIGNNNANNSGGNSFEGYIPFGLGSRNCVGQSLAQDELYLAVSNILLNFKINTDGIPIDTTEIWALTIKPKKFNVLLETRV